MRSLRGPGNSGETESPDKPNPAHSKSSLVLPSTQTNPQPPTQYNMVVKPNKSGGAYAKSGYTDMQGEHYSPDWC